MSLAGTRLGTYEIGPAIGKGGMAEVYRAKDSKLGRDVAIKVLLASHLFSLGLVLSGLLCVVKPCAAQQGRWSTKADMPTPRWLPASAVVHGKIVVIGGTAVAGTGRQHNLHAVEVYDPETDTWTRDVDMPTARGWLSASVVDRKVYAIGGGLRSQPNTSEPMLLSTVEAFIVLSPD